MSCNMKLALFLTAFCFAKVCLISANETISVINSSNQEVPQTSFINSRDILRESPVTFGDSEDPLQQILPKVKFNCEEKPEGYFADKEFCGVFHYCKTNGFRFTFICPPNSYFNDRTLTCDYDESNQKRECINDSVRSQQRIDTQNEESSNGNKETKGEDKSKSEVTLKSEGSTNERVEVELSANMPDNQLKESILRSTNEINRTNAFDVRKNESLTSSPPITKTITQSSLVTADPYLKKRIALTTTTSTPHLKASNKGGNEIHDNESSSNKLIVNNDNHNHVTSQSNPLNNLSKLLLLQTLKNKNAATASTHVIKGQVDDVEKLLMNKSHGEQTEMTAQQKKSDNNNGNYDWHKLYGGDYHTVTVTTAATTSVSNWSPVFHENQNNKNNRLNTFDTLFTTVSPKLTTKRPIKKSEITTTTRSISHTPIDSIQARNEHTSSTIPAIPLILPKNSEKSSWKNPNSQQTSNSQNNGNYRFHTTIHHPSNPSSFQTQSQSIPRNQIQPNNQYTNINSNPNTPLTHQKYNFDLNLNNQPNDAAHMFGLPRPKPPKKNSIDPPFYASPEQILGPDFFNNQQFIGEGSEQQKTRVSYIHGLASQNQQRHNPNIADAHQSISDIMRSQGVQKIDSKDHYSQSHIRQRPLSQEYYHQRNHQHQQQHQQQQSPFHNMRQQSSDSNENSNSGVSISIPVLVPTGMSPEMFKRRITSSNLRPTIIPYINGEQEIPAYVVDFDTNLDRSGNDAINSTASDNKRRSKRQLAPPFPFAMHYRTVTSQPIIPIENPYSSSNYIPVFATSNNHYNHHNNFNHDYESIFGEGNYNPFVSGLIDVNTPVSIGQKPRTIRFSEQQNVPTFMVPQNQGHHVSTITPNPFMAPAIQFAQNPYDFSEFSEFENLNHIPFSSEFAPPQMQQHSHTVQHMQVSAPKTVISQDYGMSVRPVQIRRPGFKRPPNRKKIPSFIDSSQTFMNTNSGSMNMMNDATITNGNNNRQTRSHENHNTIKHENHNIINNLSNKDSPAPHNPAVNPFAGGLPPPRNINDAIKIFDDPNTPYFPIGQDLFDSSTIFKPPPNFFGSPPTRQIHQQQEQKPYNPVANAIQELSTSSQQNHQQNTPNNRPPNMIITSSGSQIHAHPNSRPSQQHSFSSFGLPDIKLPNIDLSETYRNVLPQFNNDKNQTNILAKETQTSNKNLNNHQEGVVHLTPAFVPFGFYQTPPRNQNSISDSNKSNTSDKTKSENNEKKEVLTTARTQEIEVKPSKLFATKVNWHKILSKGKNDERSKTTSTTTTPKTTTTNNNVIQDDENKSKFGARLRGSQSSRSKTEVRSPTISVKTTVSSVSSSNPTIIVDDLSSKKNHQFEKKKGNAFVMPNDQRFVENHDHPLVNANHDREVLLMFYNSLNEENKKSKKTTTTTTKPPITTSTFHSIRPWTGWTYVTKKPTTPTPTDNPFDDIDFKAIEPTSTLPTTTRGISPYRKVFSAYQSGIHTSTASSTYIKPRLFERLKARGLGSTELTEFFKSYTTTMPTPKGL